MPAYIALKKGFFREVGLDVSYSVDPTAWLLPDKLLSGKISLAILPWTRTVSARDQGGNLVVIAGSGFEEPAVVVRRDSQINSLSELKGRKISLPAAGGMKDLTSQALFKQHNMTPENTDILRLPSGDAAMLSLLSGMVDATTNVEPFAAMAVELGIGKILARGEDILPGTPGCSVATTDDYLQDHSHMVLSFLKALLKAEEFCNREPDEAARISSRFIGIRADIIRDALKSNQPRIDITHSIGAMMKIVELMKDVGYIETIPEDYYNFELLNDAMSELG